MKVKRIKILNFDMTVESTSINDHSVVACSATSGMNKTKE
jgi:hypothetical protein